MLIVESDIALRPGTSVEASGWASQVCNKTFKHRHNIQIYSIDTERTRIQVYSDDICRIVQELLHQLCEFGKSVNTLRRFTCSAKIFA